MTTTTRPTFTVTATRRNGTRLYVSTGRRPRDRSGATYYLSERSGAAHRFGSKAAADRAAEWISTYYHLATVSVVEMVSR